MEFIKKLSPLFTAGIFFVAVLALLMGSVYFMTNGQITSFRSEVKTEIAYLKEGQTKIERRMDGIEKRMDGIEKRMDGIEVKIDRILDRIKGP